MTEAHLGIDCGTGSLKVLAVHAHEHRVLARASVPLALLAESEPGTARQDPESWWLALVQALRTLARERPDLKVVGLGISGQQHGCVTTDEAGRADGPARLWCDTRTVAEAEELAAALGRPMPVGYTASKILHLQRAEESRFSRSRRLFLPASFLGFRLTGCARIDPGDASGTGLLAQDGRSYDERALALLGGEALLVRLPAIASAEDFDYGRLLPEPARALGLEPGLPLYRTSGDNMMSAVGALALLPQDIVLSLGTSATIFGPSAMPPDDPSGLVAPFRATIGGPWLPLVCVMNCAGVLEAVRALGGYADHAAASAAAQRVQPGSEGVCLLPLFAGERVPDLPRARGSVHGLTAANLRPEVLYRAALEGVAQLLGGGLQRFRAATSSSDRPLRVVGGLARHDLFLAILAAVLERDLVRLEEPETAAKGAALCAVIGAAVHRGAALRDALEALRRSEVGAHSIAPSSPFAVPHGASFHELMTRLHGA